MDSKNIKQLATSINKSIEIAVQEATKPDVKSIMALDQAILTLNNNLRHFDTIFTTYKSENEKLKAELDIQGKLCSQRFEIQRVEIEHLQDKNKTLESIIELAKNILEGQ